MLTRFERKRAERIASYMYQPDAVATVEDLQWLVSKVLELDKESERAIIEEAKKRLMKKHQMTESEAHYFIVKTAMDNKLRKGEFAQGVLR